MRVSDENTEMRLPEAFCDELHDMRDVMRFCQRLHSTVPAGRKGAGRREHYDKERFCLSKYLSTIAKEGFLKYPVIVCGGGSSESPDIMLKMCERRIGLEITEATDPEFQQEQSEDVGNGSPVQVGPIDWDRTKDTDSPGFLGCSMEEGLCKDILDAVQKKIDKMRSPHWRLADSQDILIYDNSRYIGANLASVLKRVNSKLRILDKTTPAGTVGVVSVLTFERLMYDLASDSPQLLPIYRII